MLFVDNNPIEFKIDTGADVSVIPAVLLEDVHIKTTVLPTDKTLKGPNQVPQVLWAPSHVICKRETKN
jgi:hypothetical protein